MALSWLHRFHSPKADGIDSTLVKPSNWNDEHNVTTTLDGVMLGRLPGSGPGDIQDLPMASAVSAILPAGLIMAFAGGPAPTGWLLCQGQLLLRADYVALSTAIGGTYNIGGETALQFRLPDLRGRVPTGVDAGAGRLPGWNLGVAGGASTSSTGNITSTGYTNNNLGNLGFVQTYSVVTGWASAGAGSGAGSNFVAGSENNVQVQGYTTFNYNLYSAVNGSSGAFNIVQPTIALNYLIKT